MDFCKCFYLVKLKGLDNIIKKKYQFFFREIENLGCELPIFFGLAYYLPVVDTQYSLSISLRPFTGENKTANKATHC